MKFVELLFSTFWCEPPDQQTHLKNIIVQLLLSFLLLCGSIKNNTAHPGLALNYENRHHMFFRDPREFAGLDIRKTDPADIISCCF